MTKLLTAALTAICLAGPAFAVTVDNPEDIAKAEGIQTPFQTEEACDFKGTTCLVAFNILPPSQRLVIEFLSGACGVIGNNVISLVRLTTTVSGVAANHAFVIGPPLNSGFSSGF